MNLAGNESRSTQSGMGGVSSSKSQKEMFTCSVWGGGPVGPRCPSKVPVECSRLVMLLSPPQPGEGGIVSGLTWRTNPNI